MVEVSLEEMTYNKKDKTKLDSMPLQELRNIEKEIKLMIGETDDDDRETLWTLKDSKDVVRSAIQRRLQKRRNFIKRHRADENVSNNVDLQEGIDKIENGEKFEYRGPNNQMKLAHFLVDEYRKGNIALPNKVSNRAKEKNIL